MFTTYLNFISLFKLPFGHRSNLKLHLKDIVYFCFVQIFTILTFIKCVSINKRCECFLYEMVFLFCFNL